MTAYEIISKKRDKLELTEEEISFFIRRFVKKRIPDYQMSALLMAIYLQGMSISEMNSLTKAYIDSGKTINLENISGIKVDKHSTGGVGDKVSIILAPIVAAAGVRVPMISGRGLGHTGGTLDKLESIPGFKIDYSISKFKEILDRTGACLIGQTNELAPADKKIYALRDVTATVQSIPLIAASIMSKKIAEGIDALVLDVKTGTGAFMRNRDMAEKLAKTLIRIGENYGKTTVAFITKMDAPLGNNVGNWLEILECLDCLQGKLTGPLMELTHRLSGAMIHLGGHADNFDAGYEISKQLIANGTAWQKFLEIVTSQGGDVSFLENPDKYSRAKFQETCLAPHGGWIESINALEVGLSAIQLGAGRQKAADNIDPTSGIVFHTQIAKRIEQGEKIFTLHTNTEKIIPATFTRLKNAIKISDKKISQKPIILEILNKTNLI